MGVGELPVDSGAPFRRARWNLRVTSAGPAGDRWFVVATTALAAAAVAMLGAIVLLLVVYAWPALGRDGLGFLATTTWDPVFERFGAAHFVYGTLVTSAVALVLAVPVAVGAALFVAEYAPEWLREPG